MESLWAPWRMEYIRATKDDGCFLCRHAQSADDAANLLLIRDRTCFAILNRYPYNPGHLLVCPYKHTGALDDLTTDELGDLLVLTRRCQQLLTRAMRPEGFNIGLNVGRVAGAGVLDHVHFHLVPRWNGDANFMPVLADVRVVPQALAETYELLRKHR
jgi:ATP adenylyltransferase